MSRGAAATVALALSFAAAPTVADPIRSADDRWQLELTDAWARDQQAPTWRNDTSGQKLVIRRINGPSPDAWRGRGAFFDSVEAGTRQSARAYKRIKRSVGKAGRVPTMDLWFSYEAPDGERAAIAMRFLFFRRYAMVLAVDTSAAELRNHRRTTRKLLRSFIPYFEPTE